MATRKRRKPETIDIPTMTVVVVEWEDAWASPTAQISFPEEALQAYRPMIRRSLGYWLCKTDDVVIIATDDDRFEQGSSDVGSLAFIPTGMVRSIRILCKDPRRRRCRGIASDK
jgi:hypothetical protein